MVMGVDDVAMAAKVASATEGAIPGEMTGGSAALSKSYGHFQTTEIETETEEINDHLKDMGELGEKSVNYLKSIADSVKGISPLLDQQIILINKSMQLFLRPLLDSVGKWIQPFVVALYKVVLDWYKLATMLGYTGTTEDLAGKLTSLEEQRQFAVEQGDKERVARIDEQIAEVNVAIEEEIVQMKKNAEERAALLLSFHDPFLNTINIIMQGLTSFGTSIDAAKLKLDNFSGVTSVVYTSPEGEKYGTHIESGQGYSGKISDIIYEGFAKTETQKQPQSIDLTKSPVASAIKTVKDIMSGGSWASLAFGGEISKSGFYNLHAGEIVLNAGEVAMMKKNGGGNFSFNNTFNISGGLNSEFDVRMLAKKLAEYQEVELRRRTSYM